MYEREEKVQAMCYLTAHGLWPNYFYSGGFLCCFFIYTTQVPPLFLYSSFFYSFFLFSHRRLLSYEPFLLQRTASWRRTRFTKSRRRHPPSQPLITARLKFTNRILAEEYGTASSQIPIHLRTPLLAQMLRMPRKIQRIPLWSAVSKVAICR